MNKTTKALKLAGKALGCSQQHLDLYHPEWVITRQQNDKALAAIREALSEPVNTRRCSEYSEVEYSEQVKQEPVAYTNKEQVNELIKESARLIGSIKDEGDQYLTAIDALRNAYRIGLKDSPVDAKAIRAEALEEAEERVTELYTNMEFPFLPDITAAIRGLK